ncbi:tetratricopeptide repeat protein [Sphingobacterium chuzhouense]|uniref:Tetratricopeptide repeat protein n=1 Tax=Sphingobacterium chuzhouense TaxID=1742264 RepID=A0ABR7XQ34_9SPHI|nr:tetratricopeptide repeat protein [Sphingobacterium chuzhouense]MBD1420982.1 tetratricopeptide repeat protein [Sphingobacterium chuzhouense]
MRHIESYWEQLTLSSNELFQNRKFKQALAGYKEALYRAEVMNDHREACLRLEIPYMQLYIISCNNLSNTYIELGQLPEAENLLKRVIYYLLHLSGDTDLNKDEILLELRQATVELVVFGKEYCDQRTQESTFELIREEIIK